ncbi:unnamed protein product, partial [Hymenolepis diminuta]
DSASGTETEGVEQQRLRSDSEGTKTALFQLQESSKITGKPGGKKISFDGIKTPETSTRISPREGSCGLFPIGEEDQHGTKPSVKKDENAEDKNSVFKVSTKSLTSKLSPLPKPKADQFNSVPVRQSVTSDVIFPLTNAGTPLMSFFGNKV